MAWVQIMPVSSRLGKNTTVTWAIPQNTRSVAIRAIMDDSVILDIAHSLFVTIETSFDNQATWRRMARMEWYGGVFYNWVHTDEGESTLRRPMLKVGIYPGMTHLRGVIEVPVRMHFGFEAEVL